MRCNKCSGNLDANARTCPRCGEAVVSQRIAGMLKTSTILISADNTEGVYRSVEDVPEPLRKKLLRSTNSLNSRTMLIADRRGRQEIARALKKLPGASQRRLSSALAGRFQSRNRFRRSDFSRPSGFCSQGSPAWRPGCS